MSTRMPHSRCRKRSARSAACVFRPIPSTRSDGIRPPVPVEFVHHSGGIRSTVPVDPKNPNVVWVGTGEGNSQRSVAYGDGIYKSEDGGRTWKNLGLKNSEHIARVVIDPKNSNVV
jgi:hypothetical protein